jgi:predicted HD superfamily hydrolase involved in NAD metabolism
MCESFGILDSFASRDARHLRSIDLPENLFVNASASPVGSAGFSRSHLRKQVLVWLRENVPDDRLRHILRVEAMAVELAHHHHLAVDKAAQAGLMHDLAKFFKPQRLLQMAQIEGLELDSVVQLNPHLLHAKVGAIVARDEFGVHDQTILQAIRNHTLGAPGMDALSCVVFLADSLEPGRGETLELEQLRQACWQDLHRAVWLTCDYSLSVLLSTHRLIHPRMVLTRNWALEAVRRGTAQVGGGVTREG